MTSTLAGAAISAGFKLDASTSVYPAMNGDNVPYIPQRVFVPEFILPAVDE